MVYVLIERVIQRVHWLMPTWVSWRANRMDAWKVPQNIHHHQLHSNACRRVWGDICHTGASTPLNALVHDHAVWCTIRWALWCHP